MHDEINDNMDNCNTIEEANSMKESLSEKIKTESAKYLEEIRQDHKEYKDRLSESTSFTKMSIVKEKMKIDKNLSEEIKDTGKYTSTLLTYLDKKYNGTIKYLESITENITDNNVNNNKDKDINNSKDNNLSTKDKSSPVDFILEKKSTEMPDIYETGGDD